MMDYHCAKFGDFVLSRFGFIVRTDRHTHRQTESQIRMIAILTRLSSASVNSLCENYIKFRATFVSPASASNPGASASASV